MINDKLYYTNKWNKLESSRLRLPGHNLQKHYSIAYLHIIFGDDNESKYDRKTCNNRNNRSILFLNVAGALFIRRVIDSKIQRCTMLNLSPCCSLLSLPSLRHSPQANSQIATLGESCRRKCSIMIAHN